MIGEGLLVSFLECFEVGAVGAFGSIEHGATAA